jgi:hypothetical protein
MLEGGKSCRVRSEADGLREHDNDEQHAGQNHRPKQGKENVALGIVSFLSQRRACFEAGPG